MACSQFCAKYALRVELHDLALSLLAAHWPVNQCCPVGVERLSSRHVCVCVLSAESPRCSLCSLCAARLAQASNARFSQWAHWRSCLTPLSAAKLNRSVARWSLRERVGPWAALFPHAIRYKLAEKGGARRCYSRGGRLEVILDCRPSNNQVRNLGLFCSFSMQAVLFAIFDRGMSPARLHHGAACAVEAPSGPLVTSTACSSLKSRETIAPGDVCGRSIACLLLLSGPMWGTSRKLGEALVWTPERIDCVALTTTSPMSLVLRGWLACATMPCDMSSTIWAPTCFV